MKKVLLFVYDSFAEFEISILITCLRGKGIQLETFSINTNDIPIISAGNLKILADHSIKNINSNDYEALLIPGGSPYPLLENELLLSLIRDFYTNNKMIGAICGGPALLGAAGILNEISYTASLSKEDREYADVLNWTNKRQDYLVIDQNVITATGSNYLKFAEEVLRALGTISEDDKEPLKYFAVPSIN
ncbi:DJ-1/PfpI family protein [Gottfriedia solisilvae]|uniref:DJ-1/PfpI family protein n=1 Tax=Gottfriedia solisilvae TaxID=1516104 RepID=UPI003D2F0FF5